MSISSDNPIFVTKVAKISIIEEGICLVTLDTSKQDFMGKEEALEIIEGILSICKQKPHLILTDARMAEGRVEPIAREIISKHVEYSKIRIAEAFLINSLANLLIANFYIKFNRPPNPTKVFNNLESALEWLRSQNK